MRAFIRSQYDAEGVSDDRIHRLAKVLRTSIAFESLENEGLCAASALERLKRSGDYDEEMLEVLGWTSCTEARPRSFVRTKSARTVQRSEVVRAPAPPEATNNTCISERDPVDDNVLIMPLAEVIKGMRFASDVLTSGGVVLVPRGQVVTSRLVERIGSAWSSFAYGLHVRIMRPQPDENQQPGFSLVV